MTFICKKENICKKSVPSSCGVCPTNPMARLQYGWGRINNWMVTDLKQTQNGGWKFEINGLKSHRGEGEPLIKLLNNYCGFNR